MRQIHPVSFHEKFVASGVYTYLRGMQPTGTLEYWTIHQLPDGSQFVRADQDGRKEDGVSILMEVLHIPDNKGGHIERFDAHFYAEKEKMMFGTEAQVRCVFFDDYVQISTRVENYERESIEMTLPRNYVVGLPVIVTLGFTITGIHDTKAATPVFGLEWGQSRETALSGRLNMLSVRYSGTSERYVAGHEIVTREYSVYPPLFGSTPQTFDEPFETVWLDEHQILVEREDSAGERVVLTQYARRPEPSRNP